jgi:uncharacterized membrane protein YczE
MTTFRAPGALRSGAPIVRTVLWPSRRQLAVRAPRLIAGLVIVAFGVALMVRAGFGLSPYEVLNQGLALHTPLTIGQASIAIGLVVLFAWVPLRQRPGIGTVANVVGVGLMLDAWLLVLPAPELLPIRLAWTVSGVLLVGVGIGLYIGAGLGPGPRDGVMTGLASRGYPVWAVRMVLESSALLLGWFLGGTVGLGTVAFAAGVPIVADRALKRLSVPDDPIPARPAPTTRG